jgi:hypothetical protein
MYSVISPMRVIVRARGAPRHPCAGSPVGLPS